MATRNLTARFELLRAQYLKQHKGSVLFTSPASPGNSAGSPGSDGRNPLLASGTAASDSLDIELGEISHNNNNHNHNKSNRHELPPEWVDIVDSIQRDQLIIKSNTAKLRQLHTSRLKISFEDASITEQEEQIELLTQDITRLLRRCESSVKSIASVGNSGNLPIQERTVRLNVMRAEATELQRLSKEFRTCQKEFLSNLRSQEQVNSSFGFEESNLDSKTGLTLDEALERGLTAEQITVMQEIEAKASEREREIIKIAQSINELASLFRELNILVIEQGTILDRIDYNIEQTLIQVGHGTKELVSADNYSKKAYTLKCILLLAVICIILLGVLIWKHS